MSTITAQDILKTNAIIKGSTNDTLKQALATLTRSHDAMFVFDDKNKFVGIISPYYVIFKSKYPPETKLINCLYKPPKITLSTSIWDIAKLMVESKVYYLPVITNGTFLGIVTANRILKTIAELKPKQPIQIKTSGLLITIKHSATLSDAYQLMRDKQISRLPVVNQTERLIGIVTRFDIQEAFAKPKKKPRFLSRSGNKVAELNQPLDKYYKKLVVTLPVDTNGNKIVQTPIENNVGSVVVIDKNRKPVEIVSVHDILDAVNHARPSGGPNIIIDAPSEFIHESQLSELCGAYLKQFSRRYNVYKLNVHVKVIKNAAGEIKKYGFQMKAAGSTHTWLSKDDGFDWKQTARNALAKLERQMRN